MKTIFVTLLIGAAMAADDKTAPIESQVNEVGLEGNFKQSWTGNGIAVQEQGTLKNVGQKDEAQVIQGGASWTAPDGTPVQISWSADENGANIQGSHVPTPPPPQEIPAYIQRALEWAAAHPYNEEAELKKTY
ncbi:endocuticle structural glycoprotein SgAbd-2 isoform X2 [Cephus cinctus]|uniref:Endocuticle structural glycoprotein SgAbd-2 isoform X2 n=1 Tax=Cephus cinctus TaxID=211228 RepID=A0AAJ7FK92_CEPCN|nr:endocuticle structural glycoprotein SgAbd-2 isoform X2 [Cephus cinctus]XP_024941109.1 endocuticle structural glycoprotein SgAbd-2 isoform X2 [Cephus cinctus]